MSVPPAAAAPQGHSLFQAFQSLIYVVVVALFILTFTAQPFLIPSSSMEPTLLVGDFLLVNKQPSTSRSPGFAVTPSSVIHRGDIVVFHYPVDPSRHLVKRVIGLPEDRIRLRNGHAIINGQALSEPYAIFRPSAPDAYRDDFPRMDRAIPGIDSRWWIQMRALVSDGELTVPPDLYFVLGDNRNDSEDSRYWGFVPRSAIVGKPFLLYFSLNEPPDSPLHFARWDRTLRILH